MAERGDLVEAAVRPVSGMRRRAATGGRCCSCGAACRPASSTQTSCGLWSINPVGQALAQQGSARAHRLHRTARRRGRRSGRRAASQNEPQGQGRSRTSDVSRAAAAKADRPAPRTSASARRRRASGKRRERSTARTRRRVRTAGSPVRAFRDVGSRGRDDSIAATLPWNLAVERGVNNARRPWSFSHSLDLEPGPSRIRAAGTAPKRSSTAMTKASEASPLRIDPCQEAPSANSFA